MGLRDHPLNARQLEVLAWIGDGCPEGMWADQWHKAVATALVNRRLSVGVGSRTGGRWTASLTDDGRYYLEHGRYPRASVPVQTLLAAPRAVPTRQPHPQPERKTRASP